MYKNNLIRESFLVDIFQGGNLLDISLKHYIKHKQTDLNNDNFKNNIQFELSEHLKDIVEVTDDNINMIIDKLIDTNSTSQLLVDEISLCNMKKYIELNPQKAVSKWNKLLDKNSDLVERVDSFKEVTIEDEKEFTRIYGSDFYIELDSISYILASIYFGEYPIYRGAYFKKFLQVFDRELIKSSFGQLYNIYVSIVNIIVDRLCKLDLTSNYDTFDAEEFISTFVLDEKLRAESRAEYLKELSLEFERYSENINLENKEDYKRSLERYSVSSIDFSKSLELDSLYFEDEEILKKQISSSLIAGKSIILTGPPGTGKSKLAQKIAESLEAEFKMVTAMSSWSSYDTIGGYKPCDDGRLYFEEGIFLSCLKDRLGNNINKWLIIDEMNRGDIDKAFGPFFSTLSGDDVVLGLKDKSGRDIELLLEENLEKSENVELTSNKYIIPKDFRIIGTINTIDKTSLYDMSYAFMRRFAFIPVSIPRIINCYVVREFTKIWNIAVDDVDCEQIAKIWNTINKYRKIGPSIIEDIVKFIAFGGDYTSSIIIYILPQLEGLFDDKIKSFTASIEQLDFIEDTLRLKVSIEDFFNLNLSGE